MKTTPKLVVHGLALFAALWAAGNVCLAKVGLTVSPSVTSNTYPGFVTLNITGLTNNDQSVKVQTYLDLNGNGVVDAGEPLMDAFTLTNGGAAVIGGVTNISVPYDSNPATDTITATLSFAPPLENVVGQKIYRVTSDSSGAFTPVTATFDVTNAALGQSVSGVVYSNGIAPLPNAVVVALTLTNQNYVGSVVADASGHYFMTLPTGTYILLPALPGYYTDQSLLPVVTLGTGMSATNNLIVTNGTVAIAGSVANARNSNTLGGVFLQAQSGSLFGVAFTDTNGNYTVGATSNDWKISVTAERLSRRGYLAPQGSALTVDAASGNITGANIDLYKGNALFYGQLTISNLSVPNVSIGCNDNNQLFQSKGYTDTNGDYAVAALVDTNLLGTNVNWFCTTSAGGQLGTFLANFIFNSASVALTNGQAFPQNFAGLLVSATISGRLVDNQGVPVSGVGVGASATINGEQYVTSFVDTGTNGSFAIGAVPGQWLVNLNCCGSDGVDNTGYYDPTNFHIVNIPPDNPVVDIEVFPADLPLLGQPSPIAASHFSFNLYGANGYNYTVQTSTNLASTNWDTLTVVSNLPGSPFLIQDFQATNRARFYRAFEGP